jgi:hypothetical protein
VHPRRVRHRFVGGLLERDGLAAAPGLVLGDEHLAAHVDHAARERVGREAAEDDGVRRSEARAREHRDGELGDHAHVDRDGRPLADAELLQRVRHANDVALEGGVGDRSRVAGLSLPVVGDAVAEPCLDVAVDAVVGDVERAADVPLRVRELPLGECREGLEPRHALATLRLPELVGVAVVDLGLRIRLGGEGGVGRKAAVLVEQRRNRVVAHRAVSTTAAAGSSP